MTQDGRGHQHAGKSSREFLDAAKVLGELRLSEGQVVLDAGSGSGHFSRAAAGFHKVRTFEAGKYSYAVLFTK